MVQDRAIVTTELNRKSIHTCTIYQMISSPMTSNNP